MVDGDNRNYNLTIINSESIKKNIVHFHYTLNRTNMKKKIKHKNAIFQVYIFRSFDNL